MKASAAKKLKRDLQTVFGLQKLRPGQREVIELVLNGEDVLAIMPTGGGKSLCYQLPGLVLEGMTLVVSPLISLMKDQADKLEEIGLEAANLNSAVPASEQQESLESVEREESHFILTTPERLTDDEFLGTIRDKTIDFVVVDEAHCISTWGHDFRPAFLDLREAFRQLGDPPVLALTATATPEVIDDIKKQLGRPKMKIVHSGIYRPNLRFEVVHTTSDSEKISRLSELLRGIGGSKIVYCATVKAVDEVTKTLKSTNFEVESYHGKMSAKSRTEVQDRFMAGEVETIVATNAFGMGVDKSDIPAVVHWQIPGTLEAYYQEAGRAGRDGEVARCILLYDTRDRRVQQFFMGGRYPSADDVWNVYLALQRLQSNSSSVRLAEIQSEVGDAVSKNKVRVGLNLLKDEGILREHRGAAFELLKRDLGEDKIAELANAYTERGMSDREKLERMMLYAQSGFCRWDVLTKYFETEEIEKCDTCDNCVTPLSERLEIEQPSIEPSAADEKKLLDKLRRANKEKDLNVGDVVKIPKFGEAQIESVSGDKVDVVLPDGEHKTFKTEFVKPAG